MSKQGVLLRIVRRYAFESLQEQAMGIHSRAVENERKAAGLKFVLPDRLPEDEMPILRVRGMLTPAASVKERQQP